MFLLLTIGDDHRDRTTIDFSTVPFAAISYATRQFISSLLNPKKFLPCENGLPRLIFVYDYNSCI